LVVEIAKQRKELASELGVAFWNWIEAMGGPKSMIGFVDKKLAIGDQTHFTERGGAWVSRRLTRAILQDFAKYLAAHPAAGCDDGDRPELAPWPVGAHP